MIDLLSKERMEELVDLPEFAARTQACGELDEMRRRAITEFRLAQVEMFREVVEVVRPALHITGSRIAVRWSPSTGKVSTDERMTGLQPRPRLEEEIPEGGAAFFLDHEGKLFLFHYDAYADGWMAQKTELTLDALLGPAFAALRPLDWIEELSRRLDEQLLGKGTKRAQQLLTRAGKLRALTVLLKDL
jgi:hypothetical protein